MVSLARVRPVRGGRTRIKYVISLTGLNEVFCHSWHQSKKFEMADRRDWGGGGDDPEESTQRMIERIWESLTDIQRRRDQQAPVPPIAVPLGDGETVPIVPVPPPPRVEVPFVAPLPPPPPVLLAEELVMQVEKFLRLQLPTYSGGPNLDTAEHWVHEIERVFETMRCPATDKVVLAAYQLRGFALEWWRLKMQTIFVGWSKFGPEIRKDQLHHVDANLCDLQNIGLPEDSFLSPFSLSLALFSCPLLPHYFQQLQKVSWRIVEREVVTNRPRKRRSKV
ncbi:hypothetical protein Taro_031533 [Colocasia esculenta]|uniref:Retrotransposon gag domain-containing protein n=1 Tax=Colocasia esculenta TaxID=4460 RepID=A0A843VP49_COLES|nr:hypothetical protein [Colocasia esculenta]